MPIVPPRKGGSVRNHVVITGTGRAGTTFLVELLTKCGCNTGYTSERVGALKDPIARAGLETDIRKIHAPYIVKSPWFCDHAAEVLSRDDIAMDHVLIPVRDVREAAGSRQYVQARQLALLSLRARLSLFFRPRPLTGGLWHARNRWQQEAVLQVKLYNLIHALSGSQIPVTLLHYPRLIEDSRFLYEKIAFLLHGMGYPEFEQVFRRTARRELVHRFADDVTASPLE